MTTDIGNDLVERIRIDNEEVTEVTIDGDVAFQLNADFVLDLFNTGAISADSLGLYEDTVFDSLEVTVGGNTDFTTQSVSQTTSGSNFDITVNGNYQPTSESVTIEGSGTYDSAPENYYDVYSESDTISVGDTAPPENETVYISDASYELDELWIATESNEFGGNTPTEYHATIDNGTVYTIQQDSDNTVKEFDAQTGTEIGSFKLGSSYDSVFLLASDENSIYVWTITDTGDDILASFDFTGSKNWSRTFQDFHSTVVAVDGDYLIVGMSDDNEYSTVYLLDKDTGTEQSELYHEHDSDIYSVDIDADAGIAVFGGDEPDAFFAVTDLNGNQQYKELLSGVSVNGVAIDTTLQDRIHVGIGVLDEGNDYYRLYDLNGNLLNSDEADSYYYDGGGSSEESVDNLISHGRGCYGVVYNQFSDAELHEWDADGNYSGSEKISGSRKDDLIYGSGVMGAREDDGNQMQFYYVGGGETTVTIGSNTITASDLPTTESINLSTGSTSVSIDSESIVDVEIDWDEDNRTTDPSVTIDGSTVSHSGPLANGETKTGNIDITGTGTYTASVSTNGEVTVDVDWTEREIVKDVDFTFNGVTESVTGQILNDEQYTLDFGVSDINDSDNSVDVTAGGNSNPNLQLTFLLNTENAIGLTDFEDNWDYDENGDNVLLEYWLTVESISTPNLAIEGDEFNIDATIENIGIKEANETVELNTNEDSGTDQIILNPKESYPVSFRTSFSSPGDKTIYVETPNDILSTQMTILEDAYFDVHSVSAPNEVETGETFTVSGSVSNNGDVSDTQSISYNYGGSTTETISSGSSTSVSFTDSFSTRGSRSLSISSNDDSDSTNIDVYEIKNLYNGNATNWSIGYATSDADYNRYDGGDHLYAYVSNYNYASALWVYDTIIDASQWSSIHVNLDLLQVGRGAAGLTSSKNSEVYGSAETEAYATTYDEVDSFNDTGPIYDITVSEDISDLTSDLYAVTGAVDSFTNEYKTGEVEINRVWLRS